jgi:Glycosyltransferase family 87
LVTVPPPGPSSDFVQAFYPVGRAVVIGHSPYADSLRQLQAGEGDAYQSPYLYPPPFALLLAPFGLLSTSAASVTWHLANLVALAIAAWLIANRLFPARRLLASGLMVVLFAGFAPVRDAIASGQSDVLVLLLLVAALITFDGLGVRPPPSSPRQATAGALLAAAAMIKLYPLGIVVVAALRHRTRLLMSALGSAAALVIASVALMGPGVWVDYLRVSQAASEPRFASSPFSFGLLAFAYRALGSVTPAIWVKLLVSIVILGIVIVIVRRTASVNPMSWTAMGLLLTGCLVAFPFLEVQHLSALLLVVPGIAVTASSVLRQAGLSRNAQALLLAVMLGLPTALAFLSRLLSDRLLVRVTTVALLTAAIVIGYTLSDCRLARSSKTALVAIGVAYLALASPAFLNMAAWWSVPMSPLHLVLSEGQLYLLLVLLAGCAVLAGGRSRRVIESHPARLSVAAVES